MKADLSITGLRTGRFIRYVVLYSLSDRLKRLGQFALDAVCGGEAVQIEQRRDRQGTVFWWVRDRHTGEQCHLSSEAEVRIWLEKRYRGF